MLAPDQRKRRIPEDLYDKGFKVLFLAQISDVRGEPRKKGKERQQGQSAVQNRRRIGDAGTGQSVGFAPFAVS